MAAKKRPRRAIDSGSGVEVIDLHDPQGMLSANDRMNERYGDGHVAYLDQRRGMKVYRRIIAHGKDLLAINNAIRKLTKQQQDKVMLHYAMKPTDNSFHIWSTTVVES